MRSAAAHFCFAVTLRAKYSRNDYRWCAVIRKPGSAWLGGPPTMDHRINSVLLYFIDPKVRKILNSDISSFWDRTILFPFLNSDISSFWDRTIIFSWHSGLIQVSRNRTIFFPWNRTTILIAVLLSPPPCSHFRLKNRKKTNFFEIGQLVALEFSPELFAFTMSLAALVHTSPIFLTDIENL